MMCRGALRSASPISLRSTQPDRFATGAFQQRVLELSSLERAYGTITKRPTCVRGKCEAMCIWMPLDEGWIVRSEKGEGWAGRTADPLTRHELDCRKVGTRRAQRGWEPRYFAKSLDRESDLVH